MILITGVTGHLGDLVLKELKQLDTNEKIAVMARSAEKAAPFADQDVETRIADYDDYASLVAAFKGVDKLYFVSGSDIAKRLLQHKNVVDAAKEAKVKHIIYTSFIRESPAEDSPIPVVAEAHINTENWIFKSGMDYTLLRHNLYMEVIPMFLGEQVIETGMIYLPAGNGKTGFVMRSDMALAGAKVLSNSGHENKIYDFTAAQAYSYSDIAAMLSEISGKTIQYVSPSVDEFSKTLASYGVPEEAIAMAAGFSLATANGEFEKTSETIKQLIEKEPTTLKEYLTSIYSN